MHQQTKEHKHVSKDQKLCRCRGRRGTRHRGPHEQLRVGSHSGNYIVVRSRADQRRAHDKRPGLELARLHRAVVVGGDDIGAIDKRPNQHRAYVERSNHDRTNIEQFSAFQQRTDHDASRSLHLERTDDQRRWCRQCEDAVDLTCAGRGHRRA
jgi:hypothetical protein